MIPDEKFECAGNQFLSSGHNHNAQGQCFSNAATVIAAAPVLADMREFADWIKDNLKPARGRELHVEFLDATYDYTFWLHPIQASISGLVATSKEPEANHVWRIIRRSGLQGFGLADNAVINENHAWKALST